MSPPQHIHPDLVQKTDKPKPEPTVEETTPPSNEQETNPPSESNGKGNSASTPPISVEQETKQKVVEQADNFTEEEILRMWEAIAHFVQSGYTVIGITNQGGVAAGHKNLYECIEEQEHTERAFLSAIPLRVFVTKIYNC